MSSSERARRHGEVHHLRDLRKEAVIHEKKNRKRKLEAESTADADEDDEMLDVKDIDFRLAQDGLDLVNIYSFSIATEPLSRTAAVTIRPAISN